MSVGMNITRPAPQKVACSVPTKEMCAFNVRFAFTVLIPCLKPYARIAAMQAQEAHERASVVSTKPS